MAKSTKINVDNSELNKIITNLEGASDLVGNAKVLTNNKMPKYNRLKVDEQVNKAVDCLISCLELESKELSICKDTVKGLKQTIKQWNSKKDIKKQIKKSLNTKNEKKLKKSYESLVSLIGAKNAKAYIKGLSLGTSVKFSKDANGIVGFKKKKVTNNTIKAIQTDSKKGDSSNTKGVITNNEKVKQTNAKTTKKTNSKASTVASLKKNLKKALNNNKSQKAKKYYQLLVTTMGAKKTNKYLNKLGYDKNLQKKYIEEKISTVVSKKTDEDNGTNNNDNSNNSSDIKDNNHINNIIDKVEDNEKTVFPDSNEPTPPSNDLDNVQDNNQNNSNNSNTNDVIAAETVSPNEPEHNNNSAINIDSFDTDSNDFDVIRGDDDFSNEGADHIENDVTDNAVNDDNLTDIEEDTPSKNKVITIDEDNDEIESSNSSKSSNLKTVVPLGLGAIATGAAAVAGVRYVKNRHNVSMEYEDYENEEEIRDNTESQYIDSAQYENDYQDDIYNGPIGSSYMEVTDFENPEDLEKKINSNDYIDPSSIEDEDDIEDLALDELNSSLFNG